MTGLAQVFAWPTFGLMLIGMALGFVVGLLPGLGGPTTLALMLPFVFKMTPIEAFAFLLGMLAVTATTGDITSILFGIPGEPTTAATIVDGSRHGQERRGRPRPRRGDDELPYWGGFRRRCARARHSPGATAGPDPRLAGVLHAGPARHHFCRLAERRGAPEGPAGRRARPLAHHDRPRPGDGHVLGPLAEYRLFLSTDNYGLGWFLRQGVLIIFAIILAGLAVPIVQQRRRGIAPVGLAETAQTPAPWRLDGATAFNAGLVVLFAAA